MVGLMLYIWDGFLQGREGILQHGVPIEADHDRRAEGAVQIGRLAIG